MKFKIGVVNMGRMKDRGIQIDELLEELKEIMYNHPHLRLGQVIDSAVHLSNYQGSLFYLSDDLLHKILREFNHSHPTK